MEIEITIDKEGKSLLLYSNDDIARTKNMLSEISDIRELEYYEYINEIDETIAKHLNFKLHGSQYKVRIANHTYPTPPNGVLVGCRFNRNRWTIEVSISHYKPEDVIEIIKNIDETTTKYRSTQYQEKLKKFAIEELSREYYRDMQDYDAILYLTELYLTEEDINDEVEYQAKFCVFKKMFADIVNDLD